MELLPAPLSVRLARAPRLVVAPVGIGYGQEALVAWADRHGRRVLRGAAALPDAPALLWCRRRRELAALPPDWLPEHALFLTEADLQLDLASWRAALTAPPEAPHDARDSGDASVGEPPGGAFVQASFDAGGGWPLAARLARAVGDTELPLERHPLVTAFLQRLLPEGDVLLALQRVAAAPLLLPDLHPLLEVDPEATDDLLDRGFLVPRGRGAALPELLRRFLAPPPDATLARALAARYTERRLLPEALEALAAAEAWDDYLDALAAGFDPGPAAGELRLRRHLQRVPPGAHQHPAYPYLVGVLERFRGELAVAQTHYTRARQLTAPAPPADSEAGASPPGASGSDPPDAPAGAPGAADAGRAELRARIDNARGVVFALQGHLDEALGAFEAAVELAHGARLRGEARHNRAGVLVQQRRFAEAETDLGQAVVLFREGGDYVREARSLQLLALSYHQRGLLKEAQRGYEGALELLEVLGQPTALVRNNLAEVLLLRGRPAEAGAQLDLAGGEANSAVGSSRVRGYLQVNRAFWHLSQGEAEAAAPLLEGVVRSEGRESYLAAEAELLRARMLRRAGRAEEARAHARAARPLGVRAALEEALCGDDGTALDGAIQRARTEEARFELASGLLQRGAADDLREALTLIQAHDFGLLLNDPVFAPRLASLALEEDARLELFPLQLRLFGPLTLRFLGRTLTLAAFPTRKSAALLAQLASRPHPQPRESLAERFWGDARNPLHSLQTALYHLNRTLGVPVVASRRGRLELQFPVLLDVARFEREAQAVDAAPEVPPIELWKLLDDADGEPFADLPEWFEDERRHLEGLKARLLRRLVALEAARPPQAARALERLLAFEPYDLAARRQLIDVYRQLGEAEKARREAERFQLLQSEL